MLHTNTVKKKYDVSVSMWLKDFPPESPIRCGFPIEASSDEEANLKAHSLVSAEVKRREEMVERYEVTVTEKEA